MDNSSKRILITGGMGFIGSHVIDHIIKNTDWQVVVIDRLDYASNGFDRLRDSELFDNNRITIFTWDLCLPIPSNLIREIGKIEYVLHIAAGTHVDDSIETPIPFIKNNIESTLTMLEYARASKPECMLLFSTDEVFGSASEGIDYKEGDRFNPTNPYAASKASAECVAIAYANTYKVPLIITNTMNVLGERQHPQKYLPKVINCILDGKTLEIHADAKKMQPGKRHYIHARNVADAVLFILKNTNERLDPIDTSIGRFNIVGEKEIDNLKLALLIEAAVKRHTNANYKLNYKLVDFSLQRPGHDMRYSLSGEKLRNLGWYPPKTIEESIDKIVEWSLKDKNMKWLGRGIK